MILSAGSVIGATEGLLIAAEVPQPDASEYLEPCINLLDPIVQAMNSDGKSCDILSQYHATILSAECLVAYDHAQQQYDAMCTRLVEEFDKLECNVAVNCEDPHASADNNLASDAGLQQLSARAWMCFVLYTIVYTVVW